MKGLTIQTVTLHVRDMKKMVQFYTSTIGLTLLKDQGAKKELGTDTSPLLVLIEDQSLPAQKQGSAGLYHFAILFASQKHLAKTLLRVFEQTPHLFTGSADHIVSEAFYLQDPEGNGIELYWDRDTTTWEWVNNQVVMGTTYIDPGEYIELHLSREDESPNKKIGHMHLKVGDINLAKQFYVDVLGFEITAELPQALFVSVDRYHHHLGLNTWESFDASKREASLGLHSFQMGISESEYALLTDRLKKNNVSYEEKEQTITLNDPWDTTLIFYCER